MQFDHQKDFIFRRATLSDRLEVLELQKKHGLEAFSSTLDSQFQSHLADPAVLFQVALNSNGVLIGFLICTHDEWREWVSNPNFLKKSLLDQVYHEVKTWAEAHSGGRLTLRPQLITGDRKAFLKRQGAKIEKTPSGEAIVF